MAAEKEKQYTNARQRLEDITGLTGTAIDIDTTIAGQAQRSGDTAADIAASNARQAAEIMANMTEAEMQQAYRQADLILRSEDSRLNAMLRKAEIEATKHLQLAIEAAGNQQATAALLQTNALQQTEIINTALNDDPVYQDLKRKAAASRDPADIAAAQAKQEEIIVTAYFAMQAGNLLNIEKMLHERLGVPYNRPGAGAGVDGGQLDAEVQRLTKTDLYKDLFQ